MTHETFSDSAEYALKDFEGTYVGFSPTDESDIGMGEIEAVIAPEGVRTRMATGLDIEEDFIEMDLVRELTAGEIQQGLWVEGAVAPEGMRIFEVADRHWVFIDQSAYPETPQLMIIGGMGDIMGPTALFNPAQVERRVHEQFFTMLEEQLGSHGDMPRLSNGGTVAS